MSQLRANKRKVPEEQKFLRKKLKRIEQERREDEPQTGSWFLDSHPSCEIFLFYRKFFLCFWSKMLAQWSRRNVSHVSKQAMSSLHWRSNLLHDAQFHMQFFLPHFEATLHDLTAFLPPRQFNFNFSSLVLIRAWLDVWQFVHLAIKENFIPWVCGAWRVFEVTAWVTGELFINHSRMRRKAVPTDSRIHCVASNNKSFYSDFLVQENISLASINLVSRVVKEMCEKSRSCKAIKAGPVRETP